MKGKTVLLVCLLAVLCSLPAFAFAEDNTVAAVVDDSGYYVSGAREGQVDPELYYEQPALAVQATVSHSFDFGALNDVFIFILSEAFKRFVMSFCAILVIISMIMLGREHVTTI